MTRDATAQMIGLDTNVLVRFFVQDDPVQAKVAAAAFAALTENSPGFVCREVLVELVWVLERAYKLSRHDISQALDGLLETRELVVEATATVAVAIDRYRKGGAGFADQIIALAGKSAGCRETVSFDRQAAAVPGMKLLSGISEH